MCMTAKRLAKDICSLFRFSTLLFGVDIIDACYFVVKKFLKKFRLGLAFDDTDVNWNMISLSLSVGRREFLNIIIAN